MKIRPAEIQNFINTLAPYKNPILLYGYDEGLILYRSKEITKTFFKNNNSEKSIKVFDSKEKKLNDLEDAIKTNSLFSKKEIIKITNCNDKLSDFYDLFEKASKNKDILIIATTGELAPRSKLRKCFEENDNFGIIACYKTDSFLLGKILTDFAIKNDLKLQEEAISYLIENLGDNYQIIINELEKLLLLDSKVISYDLVKNLISTTGSSVHEDIVFDCLSGKKNLLGNNIDLNINDIGSANALLFNIKNILLILGNSIKIRKSKNISEIISTNMPKYLFKKKHIFEKIVKNKNHDDILNSMKIASEIELKIRQNQSMYKIFLLRGMLNIAQVMR